MTAPDYTFVTETGGTKGSRAQLARACNRYYFAAQFCKDRHVLEAACGVGQGLGYLATVSTRVVGVDIDEENVRQARSTYRKRANVELFQGDVQHLPFEEGTFDVVILYEALYYLSDPARFAAEARRVLRPGGVLLICTANKDLPDFNPSPLSHRYFSPPDLTALLEPLGFRVTMLGESAVPRGNLRSAAIRALKKAAVRFHLMPQTMRGKAFLKRLVFGRLVDMPHEIRAGMAENIPPTPIAKDRPTLDYQVIHCVARLPERT